MIALWIRYTEQARDWLNLANEVADDLKSKAAMEIYP